MNLGQISHSKFSVPQQVTALSPRTHLLKTADIVLSAALKHTEVGDLVIAS